MRLSIPLSIFLLWLSSPVFAQTAPDLENGFKNYGSYHGSDIDTVDLKSGNLMVHIPMPWTYPQRGSAIAPRNLLTLSSKFWTTSCYHGVDTFDGQDGSTSCFWVPGGWGSWVALAGQGLGFDFNLDLSLTRQSGYQTNGLGETTYFSVNYKVITPDGGSHIMVASPGAAMDGNGDQMAYDAVDGSGFHVELSNPDPTSGIPQTAVVIDRHGNRYTGGWYSQFNCRASFDNGLQGSGISQSCPEAIRITNITDANGNVFMTNDDTMGRPFDSFVSAPSSADLNFCVLNGLPFSSPSQAATRDRTGSRIPSRCVTPP